MGQFPESISVIIPTYNRKDLLARAVNSVIEQTYLVNEIIVVDDASDYDVTAYLAEAFGDRVRVIRNEHNQGGGKSRNIGVEKATSDLVAFLDSDDYWLPAKIEKQVSAFVADQDSGVVYCDNFVVDENGDCLRSGAELFDSDIWAHLLNGWVPTNTSNLVFRRNSFLELGGFDPELTSCQDHDLWMLVGLSGVKVRYVDEGLTVVTNEARNRITRSYDRRISGVNGFLSKWRTDITRSTSNRHFRWFKNQYLVRTLFMIAVVQLKNRETGRLLKLYFSSFILNPLFYRELQRVLTEKMRWMVWTG